MRAKRAEEKEAKKAAKLKRQKRREELQKHLQVNGYIITLDVAPDFYSACYNNGPTRSFTLKENHIGSVVSKILQNKQTNQ